MQGACWEYVGPMLALCWAMLGPWWANAGPMLGPCWAYVEACWAYAWPMLGHVEPKLGNLADVTTFSKTWKKKRF